MFNWYDEKMNDDGTLAGEDIGHLDNATNVLIPRHLWEPGSTEYVVLGLPALH